MTVCAVPGVAPAGEWNINPVASISTSFSDNANAANDGEERQSDQVLTLSPGVNITGRGGRVTLNLSYSHNMFESLKNVSEDSSTNILTANGRGEIWDRVAFIDFSSSVTRQVVDPAEAVSTVDTGSDNNRTTVNTVSISPSFLHHFGQWLETESRNQFTYTRSESDEITNARTQGVTFTANSGRRFSTFTFGGTYNENKNIREGDAPSSTTTTANSNYRLRLSRKYSLIGSVGWEKIDDPELSEEPNGIIWNVGISARPNSRASLEFTVGDRFDSTTYGLDATYQLSSRSSMSASYSESITTSQEQLNDNLDFLVNVGGIQIDTRTGLPFDATNEDFTFQTSLFRQRVFNFSFSTTRRRGSYSAGVNWERRKTDSTGILDRVFGVTMSASRTLSSRLSAVANAGYTFHDFGTADDREDDTYTISASLTYRLMKNTNAALSYSRSQTISSEDSNDFEDNTVAVNLTRTF